MFNVGVVIVCYHPNVSFLLKNINQLKKNSICQVFISDNSSVSLSDSEVLKFGDNVSYHWNMGNVGIAAAQNNAIQGLKKFNLDFIAFFDQDTLIPESYPDSILAHTERNVNYILSPLHYNSEDMKLYNNYYMSEQRLDKIEIDFNKEIIFSNYTISSGTVVSVNILDTIGTFDEALFIDLVDTEWCYRAYKKGIKVGIVTNSKIIHSIGNGSVSIGRVRVTIHSPIRRFYILRNSIYLFKNKKLPKSVALRLILISIVQNFILIIKVKGHRIQYVNQTLRAIKNGVIGKMGA
ncbi:glycosyltransferase family 2 protein [Vibrio cyclitrophicus]